MQFLSADYIYTNTGDPLPNGVLVTDDKGRILDILSSRPEAIQKYQLSDSDENSSLQIFRGILCPGFVNAHCHLELSHLKGKFQKRKGLPFFLNEVITGRDSDPDKIREAIIKADEEMQSEGIVVVGDICNTADTIEIKQKSPIHYHSFIELFDLDPQRADQVFEQGKILLQKFHDAKLPASLTPHAPYSVSAKLLKLISGKTYVNDSFISIHNQETPGEDAMFREAKGQLLEFFQRLQPSYQNWKASGFSSLASSFVHLSRCNPTLFVHNTFSSADDIKWAQLYSLFVWWCFCPAANLFIENKLPDVPLFEKMSANLCIGTDSLASNDRLSILHEMQLLQDAFSDLNTEKLIRWATLGGAEFYGLEKSYGIFDKDYSPGINLVTDLESETFKLTADSSISVFPFNQK